MWEVSSYEVTILHSIHQRFPCLYIHLLVQDLLESHVFNGKHSSYSMDTDMSKTCLSWEGAQKMFDVPQDIRLDLLFRQWLQGKAAMFHYPHVVTVGITSGEGQGDDRVTVVWEYCFQNKEVSQSTK